ncbi:hypothetical protein FF1_036134 [Malus domestica]|uniref:Phloem protein 2 n=1 Tax=Malus domestica TaxID=3750 RepID=A0A498JU76_MALDO|nr:hypothetical protein DVH24_011060 [Malus domestica]
MSMTTKPHFQAEQDEVKQEGNKYIFRPRGLNIVWGNDERYWKLPKKQSKDEPTEPAELIQVSWLEITGSYSLSTAKKYEISFDVELAPDAFGWRDIQAFLMAKVGKKGKYTWTKVKVAAQDTKVGKFKIPDDNGPPMRIEVPSNAPDSTVYFGLYEVWSGKWKGGLKIHQASVKEV